MSDHSADRTLSSKIHHLRAHMPPRATVAAILALAPTPALVLIAVNLAAMRASQLLGRWPEALRDNPRIIGRGDGVYGVFWDAGSLGLPLLGLASVVLAICWLGVWFGWRPVRNRNLVLGYAPVVHALAWLALYADPGGCVQWFRS